MQNPSAEKAMNKAQKKRRVRRESWRIGKQSKGGIADGGKEDAKGDADAKGKDLAGGCVPLCTSLRPCSQIRRGTRTRTLSVAIRRYV